MKKTYIFNLNNKEIYIYNIFGSMKLKKTQVMS